MSSASFLEKLQSTPTHLFFSKNDPLDPRLGELFQSFQKQPSLPQKNLLLVGYKDDRGIKNNGGREGAGLAPDGIRSLFYKLTTTALTQKKFQDMGNWEAGLLPSLPESQEGIKSALLQLHDNDNFIVSLGGGHDYGYPDGYAFITSSLKKHPDLKPLIINFDAHLDVRSDEKNINSGTPFYKILKEFHQKIDFYEIGIQEHCNSHYHSHFVKNHHGKIITIHDIQKNTLAFYLKEILQNHGEQPLFVSLDIDVLNSSEAPGCSQSWPLGLSFSELFSGFDILMKFKKWLHLGIYEVSPPLDFNMNTQRAASLFMNKYFHYFMDSHYDS